MKHTQGRIDEAYNVAVKYGMAGQPKEVLLVFMNCLRNIAKTAIDEAAQQSQRQMTEHADMFCGLIK